MSAVDKSDKKAKIKKALIQGGLVIAPRGSGKTAAIAEILAENPQAIAITLLSAQQTRLKAMLDKHNILPYGRVFSLDTVKPHDMEGKAIFLDEVPIDRIGGVTFHGAALTMPCAVKVIA